MIRREDVAHHVWGDTVAGFVTDRVISSTDQLHVLEYELPPRGEFRHSDVNPTIFGGDVLYFLAEGRMIIADPSTGEMHLMKAGEGVVIPATTWHNAFNPYSEVARVIEFFSPPPARGAASDFARRQAPLEAAHYVDERWSGRWPAAFHEAKQARRLPIMSFDTGLLSFRDAAPTHLRSTVVDTDYLTVMLGEVHPGHVEDFASVTSESVLVLIEGELWVDVWTEDDGYASTTVLQEGDAMFLPIGVFERLLVRRHTPARYVLGSGSVPEGWTPPA